MCQPSLSSRKTKAHVGILLASHPRMAAADMATEAGTRRAVIRSERFMQWQRELSSSTRRRYDDGKSTGIRTYQRKSEDMGGRKGSKDLEEKAGEGGDCHIDTLKARVNRQQQQQSLDCKRLQREIDSDHQPKRRVVPGKAEAGFRGPQQDELAQQTHQQEQQQKPAPSQPIKRRRRPTPTEDQEVQPSRRSAGGETNVAMDLPSSRGSKRSSRLLAKQLGIEEPIPPPLKLPKLQVVLSRQEIQEDWLKITGHRYAGKPKKSALIQLGLGLCTSLMCPSTIRYLNDP